MASVWRKLPNLRLVDLPLPRLWRHWIWSCCEISASSAAYVVAKLCSSAVRTWSNALWKPTAGSGTSCIASPFDTTGEGSAPIVLQGSRSDGPPRPVVPVSLVERLGQITGPVKNKGSVWSVVSPNASDGAKLVLCSRPPCGKKNWQPRKTARSTPTMHGGSVP